MGVEARMGGLLRRVDGPQKYVLFSNPNTPSGVSMTYTLSPWPDPAEIEASNNNYAQTAVQGEINESLAIPFHKQSLVAAELLETSWVLGTSLKVSQNGNLLSLSLSSPPLSLPRSPARSSSLFLFLSLYLSLSLYFHHRCYFFHFYDHQYETLQKMWQLIKCTLRTVRAHTLQLAPNLS